MHGKCTARESPDSNSDMEVEEPCEHCGQPARCLEVVDQGARRYCGLVCQSADRGRINDKPLQDDGGKWRRYRVVRFLADGAFGQVWQVYDRRLRRECALKITEGNRRNQAIQRELLTLCRLSGRDGFVTLYDYWVYTELPASLQYESKEEEPEDASGLFYMTVQELLPGTLGQAKKHKLFQSKLELWQFHFEAVYALNEAGKQLGFQHRDIGNSNIMYRIQDRPRLYVTAEGHAVRCDSLYQPVWVDFGKSVFRPGQPRNDWDLTALSLFVVGSSVGKMDDMAQDPTFDTLLQALRQKLLRPDEESEDDDV